MGYYKTYNYHFFCDACDETINYHFSCDDCDETITVSNQLTLGNALDVIEDYDWFVVDEVDEYEIYFYCPNCW